MKTLSSQKIINSVVLLISLTVLATTDIAAAPGSEINNKPVANNDNYSIIQGEPLTINASSGVLANDSDIDNDPLSTVKISDPANGVLKLNNDGSFSYTPNTGYIGSDSFTYKASDGTSDSDVAAVTITVSPVVSKPLANNETYSTEEDTELTVTALKGVLANDSSPENNPLTALKITDPANGSVTFNSDGSFVYIPTPDYYGSDSFSYKASDGTVESDVAAVTIIINPVNDAPVLDNSGKMILDPVNEDVPDDSNIGTLVSAIIVSAGDDPIVDPDPDAVEGIAVIGLNTGNGKWHYDHDNDGIFTEFSEDTARDKALLLYDTAVIRFVPAPDYSGTVDPGLVFLAWDRTFSENGDTGVDTTDSSITAFSAESESASINVIPVNDAPVIAGDDNPTVIMDKDGDPTPFRLTLNASDDGDELAWTIAAQGGHGNAVVDGTGKVTYIPDSGYVGDDSFIVKVSDGMAEDTITVNVSIRAPLDPPGRIPWDDGSVFGPGDTITIEPGDISGVYKTCWMVKGAGSKTCADSDSYCVDGLAKYNVSGIDSGMKYSWQVRYEYEDGRFSPWSEEYTFKVGVSGTGRNIQLEPGTDAPGYRMLSFTLWPDDSDSMSVFSGGIGGTYDRDNFRIGSYDPELRTYIECSDNFKVEPGKAYWVLARNGMNIGADGVQVSLSHDIEVTIQKGWNMIACPNNAGYDWNHVQVLQYDDDCTVRGPFSVASSDNDLVDKKLWKWKQGTYVYYDSDGIYENKSFDPAPDSFMTPNEGYWVKAEKENVFLKFPVSRQGRKENVNQVKRMAESISYQASESRGNAVAGSDDSPPGPMGTFGSGSSGGVDESGGGCFINIAGKGDI
ncbi:MAG: tandem-95 repeat protein [Desulfobacteraceae bacterium]|nr:tandem-95 repeat protein [Desulfobacteraceae bacterium]